MNAITISIISLCVAIIALVFNVSKFFIDLSDRNEKRKQEKLKAMKAELHVSLVKPNLVIQNLGQCDAYIQDILIGDVSWKDSKLFLEDKPSLIKKGQPPRTFKITASHDNPYPSYITIKYADQYSRKHMNTTHEEDFEL